MRIDEAIREQIEFAKMSEDKSKLSKDNFVKESFHRYSEEHKQLAEWLCELIAYKILRMCGNCRHYVGGTTHFGECHVTSDIEPCIVSVNQTACETFDYKDLEIGITPNEAKKLIKEGLK